MGFAQDADQAQSNSDLIWGLDHITQRQNAFDFVKRFENKLCVYSPTVSQMYSNYNIFFPEDMQKSMVVLPDPYAFHDTFNHIPEEAVQATGLHIVPGETINRSGLYIVISQNQKNVRSIPIPFKEGLRQILKRFQGNDPFLPVLVKGDLREFDSNMPCLHLHRLRMSALSNMSTLERQGIKNLISEKIMGIYREA
ncbi:hypothetical protein HF888_15710 [Bermanella marisrubri]|uniref:Uncharacterized protein n=1 Tax=Bermanella marisrubri TaxID=207949 RepID=Q1MZJ4_9GAMM|nr:hypothetical protein [Bermanella marisrubri]EAT11417.1 hypothetical protein RED65_05857 [Oceanobacter sp. RED65] [Bermanella marisrubri]QIZ85585.1 hypothetical protein HF888_15710 [Bermanella marisrubri]